MAREFWTNTQTFRTVLFTVLLLLVATLVSPWPSSPAIAQVGILDFQTPGLWDAAGREFRVGETTGGNIRFIRVELGEFTDGQQAYLGVSPTRQKINYDHTFTDRPVDVGDTSILLPTFLPDPLRPPAIAYDVIMYRTPSGELSAHLLTQTSNRLAIISIQGSDDAVRSALDPVGATTISQLRTHLPPDTETASDAVLGTGLWQVLNLDLQSLLGYSAIETRDYTPYLFAGIGYRNDATTLAVRSGISVPPVEVDSMEQTPPTVPTATTIPVIGPPFTASASIDLPTGSWTRTGPFGCAGSGQYSSLQLGATVTITDSTGSTLITTPTAIVGGLLDLSDNCSIQITIDNVPAGIGPYTMNCGGQRIAAGLPTIGATEVQFFTTLP